MISELLLLSKNDIPFIEAQVNIHQPTINEISFISEESFHIGCQLLTFSKSLLSPKDKSNLENMSDFEIFMSIMNDVENSFEERDRAIQVLMLLFPLYEIKVFKDKISFFQDNNEVSSINERNFLAFQEIVKQMFDMEGSLEEEQQQAYNPADALAAKIAEKLKKRTDKLAKQSEIKKIAIFSRYISILAVGERKDINDLMQYSVYQLKDEIKRYKLKDRFDMFVKAKMAGAQDLEEVEDWMKDIHP